MVPQLNFGLRASLPMGYLPTELLSDRNPRAETLPLLVPFVWPRSLVDSFPSLLALTSLLSNSSRIVQRGRKPSRRTTLSGRSSSSSETSRLSLSKNLEPGPFPVLFNLFNFLCLSFLTALFPPNVSILFLYPSVFVSPILLFALRPQPQFIRFRPLLAHLIPNFRLPRSSLFPRKFSFSFPLPRTFPPYLSSLSHHDSSLSPILSSPSLGFFLRFLLVVTHVSCV